MTRLARPSIVAALVAAAVVAAACGGGDSSGAPSTAAPVPSGAVAVEAREYTFTPSTLTVPAGEVTFSVRNAGNEAHEFEILQGETVLGGIEGLATGMTRPLTLTLAAGGYSFKCRLNGHDQLGMTGTLTVE